VNKNFQHRLDTFFMLFFCPLVSSLRDLWPIYTYTFLCYSISGNTAGTFFFLNIQSDIVCVRVRYSPGIDFVLVCMWDLWNINNKIWLETCAFLTHAHPIPYCQTQHQRHKIKYSNFHWGCWFNRVLLPTIPQTLILVIIEYKLHATKNLYFN